MSFFRVHSNSEEVSSSADGTPDAQKEDHKPTPPQAAADVVNVNATRFPPPRRRRRTGPLVVVVPVRSPLTMTVVEIARVPEETVGAG